MITKTEKKEILQQITTAQFMIPFERFICYSLDFDDFITPANKGILKDLIYLIAPVGYSHTLEFPFDLYDKEFYNLDEDTKLNIRIMLLELMYCIANDMETI